MTKKLNTSWHKFCLIDFKCNGFKGDKIFDHMSFDFLNFYWWKVFDNQFDFFLFFLFDLNDV